MIGPHIIGQVEGRHEDLLRQWQPRTALIFLTTNEAKEVRAVKAASPNTILIGRIYVPDGEMAYRITSDPYAAAEFAHRQIMAHEAWGLVDYWQVENEVCQVNFEEFQKLVIYAEQRALKATANGYKAALFGFSVGNPDLPYWDWTHPALDAAMAGGHVVLVHQYGAPDLDGPAFKGGRPWHLERLEQQVFPRLGPAYNSLKFVVGEYGIDGGVEYKPHTGWTGYTTAEDYAAQLQQQHYRCANYQERILGYNIFTLGKGEEWDSFDITGEVANRLAAFYEGLRTESTPPPPPPPESEAMTFAPKIFDVDGIPRDFAWVRQKYGAEYVPCDHTGPFIGLLEWREQVGPATMTVEMRDGNNNPLPNYGIFRYWRVDDPQERARYEMTELAGNPAVATLKTILKPYALIKWTQAPNGDYGFGVGLGDYIQNLAEGGASWFWIMSDKYPSDSAAKIGDLGGTVHMGMMKMTFGIVPADTGTPPPPPPPPPPPIDTTIPGKPTDEQVRKLIAGALGMPYTPGFALELYAHDHDLGVKLTDEIDTGAFVVQGFAKRALRYTKATGLVEEVRY